MLSWDVGYRLLPRSDLMQCQWAWKVLKYKTNTTHTAAALRSDLVGKDEVSAVFCSADSKSLLELCPDGARRKEGGEKSIPCSSGWKLPAFTIKCLVCVMLGSPCYAALPFPKAQHLGAGSEVLCHCQQEGPCQVNGSLAVAAVGSLLFSCLAFAFRLGSLLS